ncbi:macro domain-containing protein [Endozoicomonas arenosclerae]|uniref:macro domain-containing protein n=1 Tax=Endozoicomonas arenosclerae TaxID=1633495 RepID=UPI000781D24C|nr:macro domain-containing protein [Endozoicomonas arenosclerae]
MTIHYLKGDATSPQSEGAAVITHVCNDLGKWGRGFVMAISKKWPEPEQHYKQSFRSSSKPQLGDVQFVNVNSTLTVANIIGQHGIRSPRNRTAPAPVRYEAIRKGLQQVSEFALKENASVHMPRIGCGLAGGHWKEIEPIILETLCSQSLEVYVYDL